MEHKEYGTCRARLGELIDQRCGRKTFMSEMRISEHRLERLLGGDGELRQEEMIRAAKILKMCSREFTECFFNNKSSENLNNYYI